MRDICLDTETTGFDPAEGHRVVEIAAVELVNLMPTGKELHFYLNPERDMPAEAQAVHGLGLEFLQTHPNFRSHPQVDALVQLLDGARLVAHNAEFDMRFLQAELEKAGRPRLTCPVIDTLPIARRRFPGAPASLDALCRRFGIDLSERTKHGALIDTKLLAKVYLELMGGAQPDLGLAADSGQRADTVVTARRTPRPPRRFEPSAAELAAHQAMVDGLKDPLWSLA